MRLAAVFLCLTASPALALSCLQPDPMRDFVQADAAQEVWIVVDGTLSFDPGAMPRQDLLNNNAPRQTDIPARIEGHSLTPEGFTRPFAQDITLRALCFGPWCGGAVPGPHVAFLQREGAGYVAFADPCGNRLHPDAPAMVKAALTRCMAGSACEPANP